MSIGDDNNAWSLIFWFIPVGISLLLGVSLFLLALVRITILFVTIRKVKKLLFLYLRIFIFIIVYLILIIFITAYYIQYARDQDSINTGYEEYYQCLSYGLPNCSLDDSVTNYNLVMLKAFAISSLGVLLFFVFLSWDIIKFWYDVVLSVFHVIKTRKKSKAVNLINKLVYSSTNRSITDSSLDSMTVTGATGMPPEEGNEMDEVSDSEDEDETEKVNRSKDGGASDITSNPLNSNNDADDNSSSSDHSE